MLHVVTAVATPSHKLWWIHLWLASLWRCWRQFSLFDRMPEEGGLMRRGHVKRITLVFGILVKNNYIVVIDQLVVSRMRKFVRTPMKQLQFCNTAAAKVISCMRLKLTERVRQGYCNAL